MDLKEIKEITALLKEFGLNAYGFDPGVSAEFADNPKKTVQFDPYQWKWLRPLLEELREKRVQLNVTAQMHGSGRGRPSTY